VCAPAAGSLTSLTGRSCVTRASFEPMFILIYRCATLYEVYEDRLCGV
jgi:hypothetical protein